MKHNIIYTILSCLILTTFSSCLPEGREINWNIQPGDALYLPADGAVADLSTGLPTDFYWTPAVAEDNGFVAYDVLFDKAGGNFSNPIAMVSSQFNGSRPYVTMTAKQLNKIARAAGIGILEEGTIKWTVKASKGLYGSTYKESRDLNIKTMNSMDPLPSELYIYGPALKNSENIEQLQMTLTRGIDKSGPIEGVFESFCKLGSGQDFFIKDELGRHYMLNDNGTITNTPEATASKLSLGSDVIWLNTDIDGMVWSSNTVTKVVLYAAAWADNKMTTANTTLDYIGAGTWRVLDYDNATSDNSANDSRYRFNVTLGDKSMLYLGTQNKLGAEYTTQYRVIDLYTTETLGNKDWDKTFNLLVNDCGRPADVYLHMNSTNEAGTWWHEFIFK